MFGYDDLKNYYRTMFALIHQHKWDPEWIESRIPWEKYVYLDLLAADIKRADEERRQQEAAARAAAARR